MAMGIPFGMPWRKGGGGNKPPLFAKLRQWLVGSPDGLMEKDELSIVRPEPVVVDVNCPSFNGVDAVINTEGLTIDIGEVYSISILANILDDSEGMSYLALYASSYSLVEICSEVGQIYFAGGNFVFTVNTDSTPYVGTGWHKFTLEVNGSTMSGYVDDVLIGSTTIPTDPVIVDTIRIGNSVEGSFVFNGMLSQAVVTKDGKVLAEYPLQEGSGLPYDSSGNENHATANTATWTTADGIPSAALRDGFSPALLSSASGEYIDVGLPKNTHFSKVRYCGAIRNTGASQIILAIGDALPTMGIAISSLGTVHTYFPVSGDRRTEEGAFTFNEYHVFEIDYVAETMSIDGVIQSLVNGSGTLGHSGTSVEFSGRNSGDAFSLDADTSGLQLWIAGDLVRDMVPSVDGKMINRLTGTVYSSGSTAFTTKQIPALIEGASEHNAYTQWLIDNMDEPAGSHTTTQKYTAAGAMSRTNMIMNGWTLTDGGYREHA